MFTFCKARWARWKKPDRKVTKYQKTKIWDERNINLITVLYSCTISYFETKKKWKENHSTIIKKNQKTKIWDEQKQMAERLNHIANKEKQKLVENFL